MKARIVSRADLPHIGCAAWYDAGRRIYREGDRYYIPVRAGFPADCEIRERTRYRGRGYQRVGGIMIVHGDRPGNPEIDAIRRWEDPRAIVWMKGCTGVERIPETEILWGTTGVVTHRESGVWYRLDPTRVIFSQGNRNEKERIRKLVRPGERVADCYAGIGYFTLPAAIAGAWVHAMEIYPPAAAWLRENVSLNGVADRVAISEGDFRTRLAGTYDRVIMGHFNALAHLDAVIPHLKNGSSVHLHCIGEGEVAIRSALDEADISATIRIHRVKQYGPRRWHNVYDLVITQ